MLEPMEDETAMSPRYCNVTKMEVSESGTEVPNANNFKARMSVEMSVQTPTVSVHATMT